MLVCQYMVSFLVRSRNMLPAADAAKVDAYTDLAVQTIGPKGGLATELMVLVCCFGIASAYMVFVADTLATLIVPSVVGIGPYSTPEVLLYQLPLFVMLAWIKKVRARSRSRKPCPRSRCLTPLTQWRARRCLASALSPCWAT